jgi:molybdopterin-binding protein
VHRQEPLTIGEAARLLGVSVDTLRRWDRTGRIKTARDPANRRLVPRAELERLRAAGGRNGSLSARNRIAAVVSEVKLDGLLAQVELEVREPAQLVAVITRESAERLGLRPGVQATAVAKATSLMVER